MSESSSFSFSRLLWRLLRAGVYVLMGGTILFFALTRTEVGRDGLRRQLQSAFNERFAGTVQIGSLQGTLLDELIVTDVTLRDETDTLVATVDSIHTRPHWFGLLTTTVSVRSLTIVRPHLRLHRRADGTWNARGALTQTDSTSADRRLNLDLPYISVQNGRVTTRRDGDAPAPVETRWLFDYTRSEVDQLTAEASIEWDGSDRRVNLTSLSFRLPEQDLRLRSAQGIMSRVRSRWTLREVSLKLGATHLSGEGTFRSAPTDSTRLTSDLKIARSRIDHDELRRLVPRLPLRNAVAVEGRVGGPLDRLVVNELIVAHDQSTLGVEGTLSGLPDSLNVDAQLRRSSVAPADVKEVWPSSPFDQLPAVGAVRLNGSIDGVVKWQDRSSTAFDLETTFAVEGRPGAVRGSLAVSRSGSSPLQYASTLRTDTLNLAPITGNSQLASRLTGRVAVEGSGSTLATTQSTVDVRLSESQIASRQLSSADLQFTVSGRSVRGRATLQQPFGGELSLRGEFDDTGPMPLYDLAVSTHNFDLEDVHSALSSTRLNATLTTQGRGASWQHLIGSAQLDVDTSLVHRAGNTVLLPPHQMTLDVSVSPSDSSRIQLEGTIGSATVVGTNFGSRVWTSGRLWLTSLRRAIDRQFTPLSALPSDTSARPVISNALRARARNTRTDASRNEPFHLRGTLAVDRMDLLRKWWPTPLTDARGLRAETSLTLSPDTIHSTGTVTANRLQWQGRRIDTLNTAFQLSGPLRPNLADTLTAALSGRADTIRTGERTLAKPSLSLSLLQGDGTLRAQANGLGRLGPFDVNADVSLRDGYTQFTLRDLYVGAGQQAWISDPPGSVSAHSDGIVFDSLNIESPRPLTAGIQRVQLRGTVSSAPSDTLYAEMSDVLVYPILQLTSMSRPVGGRMNGQVALTGGLAQPQIRGTFEVNRLSFDRRVLGTLKVESQLTPRSPDLQVAAALVSEASELGSLPGPSLVPQGPRTLEENQLQIDGRVRLPGWTDDDNPAKATTDQLDLNVDVGRADLFFFKYIFDDNLAKAEGFTAGSIHVGGRFRRPVFDAQLTIENGRFTLPQFGLEYTASGPVTVDRSGIRTQGLTVTDESGSATLQGSVLFNEYEYLSFDLSAQLDALTVIDVADAEDLPFYGTIRASGPVSLTGPLSDATLRSEQARTTPESELFIPVSEGGINQSSGYIIFADSTGQVPNLQDLTRRDNILSDRPAGEPSFVEGLEIDINVTAPEESTVNLVFDPVVGDVVTAVGSGRVQLQRQGGEFFVYGDFNVQDGTYLFTAGEVFVRRFNISGGTLTWDGPPTNAQLDIQAAYRTRASTAGLPSYDEGSRIPIRVLLDIGGRVETPQVELSLARVRDQRSNFLGSEALDAILNRPDRTTEYATSVLLTNTFLLTTESFTQGQASGSAGTSSGGLATAGNRLAFNSVSQLVASQLNRYLGAALPNVDLNFGLQGQNPNDLDVIYGVALRLLNERLVIRGEGVYTGDDPDRRQARGPQGEFVVELRLSSRVSVEAFYRRTGDEVTQDQTLTSSTGAGLSYQTEFSTWRDLFSRIFGWLIPDGDESDKSEDNTESNPVPAAREDEDAIPPPDSGESDDEAPNSNK